MTEPVIAVVGPTASGKSDLALDIAEALGNDAAEIISADAFQLYRGMDIGTAKLPVAERRGIAHHQLDVLDIAEPASVAAYQRHARGDVAAIRGRGRRPIVCGGSGLYVRALLDDLSFPGTDPELRAGIEAWGAEHGAEALHARLAALDPDSAARIPAANERRVVRAIEVCELTGRPFSATLPTYTYAIDALAVGVRWPSAVLQERIERRARLMMDEGFPDEVRELLAQGLREAPTASRATGYPQVIAYLDGDLTRDEAIDDIALQTWRLAKRQIKWFKRDPRIRWIDGDDPAAARALVAELAG
ncbi:MAG: tRNA (adenosine(37)-N6)-dimethylallyltransferase MiaA [Actinomycetaceae bacterium]|nr:tRNA (adenosine(37)-N6)-dimethylallyltransferase MiaA [Actinomycetaceae bacterium]MDU0970021.1 tRNA (adenosine(37)-N6)-dimethylallyltransferase MiaA [Actinomycetaceae bacterium]